MSEERPVTAGIVLRSGIFAIGQLTSTLVLAPLVLMSAALPFKRRYAVTSRWKRFNLWWLEQTCGVRAEVEGREHVPPSPCIVMSKHQSAWETLFLGILFRPQCWVVKRELLWIPIFGWALALLRPIAIDRNAGRQAIQQIIDQGTRRLSEGIWVIIFPEGTRVAVGRRGRYRMGGALLASKSGYPVVPVAHNAGHAWPRNSFLKWPGTIRVAIGPVIDSQGLDAAEINRRVEQWIEGAMERLEATGPSAR